MIMTTDLSTQGKVYKSLTRSQISNKESVTANFLFCTTTDVQNQVFLLLLCLNSINSLLGKKKKKTILQELRTNPLIA